MASRDHAFELRRLDGLGEVVVRPLADGVHRPLDVGVRGHQDDRRRRARRAHALEDVVPARVVRQVDVAEDDVVAGELGRGRDRVGAVEHVDLAAVGPEDAREQAGQRVIVLEEEDVRAGGGAGRTGGGDWLCRAVLPVVAHWSFSPPQRILKPGARRPMLIHCTDLFCATFRHGKRRTPRDTPFPFTSDAGVRTPASRAGGRLPYGGSGARSLAC